MENLGFQKDILIELVKMKMPFGRYKGWTICDLPENYLLWFQQKGFPDGKLGILMATMYEIRLNGLEKLVYGLKTRYGADH